MIEWDMLQHWEVGGMVRNVNLMQYTGLTDRNDKEIYEGDVCELDNGRKDVMAFDEGTFTFGEQGNPLIDLVVQDDKYMNTRERLTVIGNIYENPELLPPRPKPDGEHPDTAA